LAPPLRFTILHLLGIILIDVSEERFGRSRFPLHCGYSPFPPQSNPEVASLGLRVRQFQFPLPFTFPISSPFSSFQHSFPKNVQQDHKARSQEMLQIGIPRKRTSIL